MSGIFRNHVSACFSPSRHESWFHLDACTSRRVEAPAQMPRERLVQLVQQRDWSSARNLCPDNSGSSGARYGTVVAEQQSNPFCLEVETVSGKSHATPQMGAYRTFKEPQTNVICLHSSSSWTWTWYMTQYLKITSQLPYQFKDSTVPAFVFNTS